MKSEVRKIRNFDTNLDFSDLYNQAKNELDVKTSETYEKLKNQPARYIFKQSVAQGGMKEVDKYFDANTKRHVAMAKLNESAPKEDFDAFIHEAWLTAQLDHPNIIKIHDLGIDDEQKPFFTMDLKSGQTLTQYIKESQNEAGQGAVQLRLLNIFIKICNAVSYAHANCVLHLDLKPDNIQIGQYGEVVICDWGLGRTINNLQQPTTVSREVLEVFKERKSQMAGTPGYMSPEQVRAEAETIQSDVYSLGSILYTILTASAPFSGDAKTVLDKTLTGEITAPHEKYKDIPKSLSMVAMKAMSCEPEERYLSCHELSSEIQKYLDGKATNVQQAGFLTLVWLLIKRNKFISLLSFVALSSIIVLTLYFLDKVKKERDTAQEALRLYQQEEQAHSSYKTKILDETLDRTLDYLHDDSFTSKQSKKAFNDNLKLLEERVQDNPHDHKAKDVLLRHLYVQQKLNDAREFARKHGLEKNFIYKVDSSLFPTSDKLDPEDLMKFLDVIFAKIDELNEKPDGEKYVAKFYRIAAATATYDQYVRGIYNHSQIIQYMLQKLNSQALISNFVFNKQKKLLGINYKNTLNFQNIVQGINQYNVLASLKLHSLKLITDQETLPKGTAESGIHTLDISESRINNFDFLNDIQSMTILVNKEQYRILSQQRVPQSIQVKLVK